jgi:rod shape-determining protein MreC
MASTVKKNTLPSNTVHNSRYLFKKLTIKKTTLQLVAGVLVLIALYSSIGKNVIDNLQVLTTTIQVHISDGCASVRDYAYGFIRYFIDADAIHRELQRLRSENLRLSEENRNLSQLLTENTELRKLLSMHSQDDANKIVVAKIMEKLSNDYTRSCVLRIGSSNGIGVDNVVRSSDGLVGRIVEVHKNWCRALFITDIKSSIPVKIGKNDINAIATGNNSKLLQITTIHEESTIHPDDAVTTSGYGNIFQDNIPVGKIIKKENAFFIEPAVNFYQLSYACVMK